MGTLFDYIKWRGDLSFREAPLNDVDSMIFSLLSYMDFSGIVPREHNGPSVPIQSAANSFFTKNPNPKKVSLGVMVPRNIVLLFRAVKDCRRFRNVEVKAHVNVIDTAKQTQFSATTFLPETGGAVIAYRGTDDTIVGWKENFNMSFLPVVPAQLSAAEYLNAAAEAADGELLLTGHSKGGNLSVYAAVHCDDSVKARIGRVWCFDGPGFGKGTLNDPAYIAMRPLIRTLVPQSSIVGMLLEHDENYTVVKSRQVGAFQHDGLSWDVLGGSFVHLKTITDDSRRLDRTLNEWLARMTPEQREQFVDALYQVLSSDNALTLTDLLAFGKNKWLKKTKDLDPQVGKTIQKTVAVLIELNAKNIWADLTKKIKKKN